jgi:hypothetical protein
MNTAGTTPGSTTSTGARMKLLDLEADGTQTAKRIRSNASGFRVQSLHTWQDTLDGGSVRRKAAANTQTCIHALSRIRIPRHQHVRPLDRAATISGYIASYGQSETPRHEGHNPRVPPAEKTGLSRYFVRHFNAPASIFSVIIPRL